MATVKAAQTYSAFDAGVLGSFPPRAPPYILMPAPAHSVLGSMMPMLGNIQPAVLLHAAAAAAQHQHHYHQPHDARGPISIAAAAAVLAAERGLYSAHSSSPSSINSSRTVLPVLGCHAELSQEPSSECAGCESVHAGRGPASGKQPARTASRLDTSLNEFTRRQVVRTMHLHGSPGPAVCMRLVANLT